MDSDNGALKTWAQNVRNSYKVRLKYSLVPKGVAVDTRYVDTPYRFETSQEAREYAKQLFPCYSFVIKGSRDPPTFTTYKDHSRDQSDIATRLRDIEVLQRKLKEKKAMLLAQQKNISLTVLQNVKGL
jgi:hypothetical protein